jgi:hypothetical protein
MLPNNPKPPGKYCLSIDPGTQNAGVCAFDSTTQTSTANAVRQLLEAGDGNAFAGRNHDFRMWQAVGENQHDMADALGQLLCYFYRNRDAVRDGRVVEAELTNRLVAPELTSSAQQQQQQQQPAALRHNRGGSSGSAGAGPSSSQKKAKHDSAARHIQAKALLQKTLTQLQAEHRELLPRTQGSAQQQSRNAEQLYKVYQTPHRNSRTLQEFLRYLNNYNQKGTNLHNLANLNARLTHLLQPPRAPL